MKITSIVHFDLYHSHLLWMEFKINEKKILSLKVQKKTGISHLTRRFDSLSLFKC